MTLQTLQKEAREEFEKKIGLVVYAGSATEMANIYIKTLIDSIITKAYKQGIADSMECVPSYMQIPIAGAHEDGGYPYESGHNNCVADTILALKQLIK